MESGEIQNCRIKSANIHVTGVCNYHCQHCFDRCLTHQFMAPEGWRPILDYLKSQGIEKVNIAGGEPFLYPHLDEICKLLKTMGFKVSIVSNGSRITEKRLAELRPYLDWLGLSVDSPDEVDEIAIGRSSDGCSHLENIKKVAGIAHRYGIKVKLNITVVKKSVSKDFKDLIESIAADRVKVLRALTLAGANDDVSDTWSVSDEEFKSFKERHSGIQNVVFEDNSDMIGSYLMFDPLGRWMVNTGGRKRFLPFDLLIHNGLESEIDISKYCGRGAIYDW